MKAHYYRGILVLVSLILLPILLSAQSTTDIFKHRQTEINQKGMIVLGSWGLVNLGVGGIGAFNAKGVNKHFYVMNASWGAVNLAIAGLGFYANRRKARKWKNSGGDIKAILKKQSSIEQILLFNTGLDIAYIVGGFYLQERARRFAFQGNDQYEKIKGYGRSFVLQGGFLFVFDLAHYLIHRSHRVKSLPSLLANVSFTGNGLVFRF